MIFLTTAEHSSASGIKNRQETVREKSKNNNKCQRSENFSNL